MTVAKYLRLSAEDADLRQSGREESNSIVNQRNLLDAFIERTPDLSGAKILEFCDDGWSGKSFERPAVKELLEQTKQGLIHCIIVKDMSRFGRDYLTVGKLNTCSNRNKKLKSVTAVGGGQVYHHH